MNGACLKFENPIRDAISRIRFAPHCNNLLISSWDSSLRLYDVDSSVIRLEVPVEAALLDCCFQHESVAFTAGSDRSVTRYDLLLGIHDTIGDHDDLATCIEYSDETHQVISAGWDRKIMSWDIRCAKALTYTKVLTAAVDSMSLCGFNLMFATGESINMYDLRNLERSLQVKESYTNLRIRCIRSIPNNCEGFAAGTVDGRVALEIPHPSNSNDLGYTFRCHPKSKNGRDHLVAVNDIVFNPLTSSILVTSDNEGYICAWDSQSRRRIFELARCPSSVASLSYNNGGQLLAIAASYSYQEANETRIWCLCIPNEGWRAEF
ncbi:mitotic checkpoint protein BUB3.3 isoform X2 [Malania oleifera]|uniref:mitotic checkpoint protein BUB3.3 isoform X2 n=1 Tax=Malania oleifera TaxID=397392 RepID=UPI0025AE6C24|nr:mitotic checkpoint protein BUB3.3 isoform X2 [Malania oleifera]